MITPDAEYLWRQITNHLSLFFSAAAGAQVNLETVKFLSKDAAERTTGPCVVIPTDVPAPPNIESLYTVPFNGTTLTLWNRLPLPATPNWEPIPNETNPLWFRHRTGTLLPAWNLYANLFGLLTFQEELQSTERDLHGRFVASYSPRHHHGLLEVPAFNEAVAALVGACVGLHTGNEPQTDIEDTLQAPVIVLSHDCDALHGNDIWTQGVRAYRLFKPMMQARLPHLSNLWWIARNAVTPQRYYFDNLMGMIDLEHTFGCRSTFYMLNGTGGRFGARSGTKGLADFLEKIPDGWDTGIHYNYDTHLDAERFAAQFDELRQFAGEDIVAGRAHYLRFDPAHSFPHLESFGIEVDESAGYPDCVGYRCGVGGAFEAYDPGRQAAHNIVEVPLVIMDTTLVTQYQTSALRTVRKMLTHLQRVGGAMTVLFHPGVFHNPEFPEMLSVYHRILQECRRVNARSLTVRDLVNELRPSL